MLKEYETILVAVDGSEGSEQAFKKAVNVAKRNGATLFIAHIIDVRAFESFTHVDEKLVDEATKLAKETLDNYVDYAKNNGVNDAQLIIEYGVPKTVIANQLQPKHKIDLIILGATGLNAMERILIGSTSTYVSRHADCDSLIVRTDINNQPIEIKKKKD